MWCELKEKTTLWNFDFLFFKRFAKLIPFYFGNPCSLIIFIFLIVTALGEQYVVYNVGIITSEYYKVLGEKDLNGFWTHSVKSLAIIICVSLIISTKDYLISVLYVIWRQLLTQHLQKEYMHSNNYYKLNVLDKAIDNPDQRITQDIDKMCNKLSTNIAVVIVSPFTICYYSYVLFVTTGWWGPTSVFGFFLLSTLINKLLMSPVVNYVFMQEQCEGFFRFKHMHIRTNAESIAFQDGSFNELTQLSEKFTKLVKVQQNLFARQFPLSLSVKLFAYLGSIFSFLLLAVPLFNGKYDSLSVADLSALISKNTFVTMYLINCFTQLVNLSTDVTVIAGTTHRISEFLEWIKINNTFEAGN
ncbi:ATP-binding cassette sub-family D member 4-like, partial [Centruroides sculpturatus]|uniref:ATP-binding cassette sub-family D member 4-like n=1 Tax=Centruroides sculpturatus TaxID=218467 RepID=UPI000C6D4E49